MFNGFPEGAFMRSGASIGSISQETCSAAGQIFCLRTEKKIGENVMTNLKCILIPGNCLLMSGAMDGSV